MRWMRVVLLLPLLLLACERSQKTIRLATTTSVDSSGLLGALLPAFTETSGIDVEVLAVGSGKAIALAEDGDVDVTITHDPAAEREFIGTGKAKVYRKIMFNDFLIAGPVADPAGIRQVKSATEGMKRIASSGSRFASRGDQSGTHSKEKALWKAAGSKPDGSHLLETGQGMAATLRVASEREAYVLSDRATFFQLRGKLHLEELLWGDPALVNTYAVMVVDQSDSLREAPALEFADWLRLDDARKIIESFPEPRAPVFHVWPGGTGGNDPDDLPAR